MNSTANIVIYGGAAGSGKTHMMLLRALMQVHDEYSNCIIFRRTTTVLRDGMYAEAKKLYKPWKPSIQEQPMRMEFPSGAVIKFNHMEHEKNAEADHQGKQYSLVVFDEGCQFTEYQVTYLMSRLRSAADGDSQMFISCNPDPDSFICRWIEWWLDEEGYPDPAKSGKLRYYCNVDGDLKFADTEAELRERWDKYLHVKNRKTGKFIYTPPKTMTFIGGTIFDNPALIEANPAYLAELNSLPTIERARLLDGNWYVRPQGSNYFERSWLRKATHVPANAVYCRAWDKASTEPSDINKYPDYTASIMMAKDRNGDFYISGNYHPASADRKDPQVLGRFRERPGSRDERIKKQAAYDGKAIMIVFPQDPGATGATEYLSSSKALILLGHKVQKDPMPPANSKLTRYTPFSSACENQMVFIVESTFTKDTLEAFYKENEAFDGERSTAARKDDWPDCTASAFNWLCKKAVIPAFTMSDFKREDPFTN